MFDSIIGGIRFQSTLSVRRATTVRDEPRHRIPISIHALREESDPVFDKATGEQVGISIHALREESDLQLLCSHRKNDISIHALREESDVTTSNFNVYYKPFQSTLSVRRATKALKAQTDAG